MQEPERESKKGNSRPLPSSSAKENSPRPIRPSSSATSVPVAKQLAQVKQKNPSEKRQSHPKLSTSASESLPGSGSVKVSPSQKTKAVLSPTNVPKSLQPSSASRVPPSRKTKANSATVLSSSSGSLKESSVRPPISAPALSNPNKQGESFGMCWGLLLADDMS